MHNKKNQEENREALREEGIFAVAVPHFCRYSSSTPKYEACTFLCLLLV
jgi:hypothetical protein